MRKKFVTVEKGSSNYRLLKTEQKSGAKYLYEVVDQNGKVISERRSNRDYVACTINGGFYFGRLDLVGKGDHGRHIKYMLEKGEKPALIAYLETANPNK